MFANVHSLGGSFRRTGVARILPEAHKHPSVFGGWQMSGGLDISLGSTTHAGLAHEGNKVRVVFYEGEEQLGVPMFWTRTEAIRIGVQIAEHGFPSDFLPEPLEITLDNAKLFGETLKDYANGH